MSSLPCMQFGGSWPVVNWCSRRTLEGFCLLHLLGLQSPVCGLSQRLQINSERVNGLGVARQNEGHTIYHSVLSPNSFSLCLTPPFIIFLAQAMQARKSPDYRMYKKNTGKFSGRRLLLVSPRRGSKRGDIDSGANSHHRDGNDAYLEVLGNLRLSIIPLGQSGHEHPIVC